MKRLLLFLALAAPLLMCFQCGCDEPDTITVLQLENATGEVLYFSGSAHPTPNVDCRWTKLPCTLHLYEGLTMPVGNIFKQYIGEKYLLIVDSVMNLRASWPIDSVSMVNSARWVSDTSQLENTNCNGIHPAQYKHQFALQPSDLQ